MRQRSQRHVVRIALDHTGLEALGDPPALLQQRRLDRRDARDVKRSGADLRKLLLQRDHRTTKRPALTIAAQAHPVAPPVDGQTQINVCAPSTCTRTSIDPRLGRGIPLSIPCSHVVGGVAKAHHAIPVAAASLRTPQDLHGLGHAVPNSRQKPAEPGPPGAGRSKNRRFSPAKPPYRGVPRGASHARVAGSKPAAPIPSMCRISRTYA